MKYWRVEREESITHVVHVQAESREEAILLAEGKYERRNSGFSGPWAEEIAESEFREESE
jgi:hypothetical protein